MKPNRTGRPRPSLSASTGSVQDEAVKCGCLGGLISLFNGKSKHRHERQNSPVATASSTPSPVVPEDPIQEEQAPAAGTSPSGSTLDVASATDKNADASPSREADDNNLWRKAYEQLDSDTKKWIGKFDTNPTDLNDQVQAQELAEIVREREQKFKDNIFRTKVGQHEIMWRDYAAQIVTWTTTIGDIAIQFAPAPSSVAWSALKGVLQVPVRQCDEITAVFGCAEKVLGIIRRGKVYEAVYMKTDSNISPDALKNLEFALVALYAKSLKFLATAGRSFEQGIFQGMLKAIIHPGMAKDLVSGLLRDEHELDKAAQACMAACTADLGDRHTKLLSSLTAPLIRVDDRVRDLLDQVKEDEIAKALNYFSPIEYGEPHRRKVEMKTQGTGEWLLEHEKFREWESSRSSTILWLQGSVGTGKSFLASSVIDRFRVGAVKSDEGFAFFYCDRGEQALQEPLSVLQSYVRQLSTVPRYPEMMRKSLIDLYRQSEKQGVRLGFDVCEKQLFESVDLYPRTTLVLDGLDECNESSRHKLIGVLVKLVKNSRRPVKVFVSSRRERDIVKELQSETMIELDAEANKHDIKKFVDEEIKEIESSGRWESISQEVKNEIKEVLYKGSSGMFRWAYLQMEQLRQCHYEQDIKKRLGRLPKDLQAAYDEILEQMNDYDKILLERAVKWVMCVRWPLSSNQLLSAIRLSMNQDETNLEVSPSKVTGETFQATCRNLLVKDSKIDVWKFPHASVIEYFEDPKHNWTMDHAHCLVTKLSLLCLIEGYSEWELPEDFTEARRMDKLTEDQSDPRHPASYLQCYVRYNWFRHVQYYEGQSLDITGISRLLKCFLGSDGSLQQSSLQYQRWADHVDNPAATMIRAQDLNPTKGPLFAVCAFGFYNLLQDWWKEDFDVSLVNEEGRDLLSIAAQYGHQQICEALIHCGADVNKRTKAPCGCALGEAIKNRHFDLMKFLLAKGADPNLVGDGQHQSCCMPCMSYDNGLEWMRILFKAGAEPRLHGCPRNRTLAKAAFDGKVELGKFLIEYGADVNAQEHGGHYGSALAAAAWNGKEEFARFLIEYGADVNTPLEHGRVGSALSTAAYTGQLECARFLIEHGADVNTPLEHGDFGSALAAAAYIGRVDAARFLIEHGADVNTPLEHGKFGSALAAAAYIGRVDAARFLIEQGADINASLEFGEYGSALAVSILGLGSMETLKYLVEEVHADLTILSKSPPRNPTLFSFRNVKRWRNAKYLVEGGYVDRSVLESYGFTAEELDFQNEPKPRH